MGKILTPEGAKKIKAELETLTGPARIEMAARLRTAIQQGDLSENADYIKAKEDQGFLEGRILELESLLKQADIVDPASTPKDKVAIGSRVTVSEEGEEPEVFFVVGSSEADSRSRKISHESPIGQALLGHKEGDTVQVRTPAGVVRFVILKLE